MNEQKTYASEAEYDEAIRKAQVEAAEATSELHFTEHEYQHDPKIEKLEEELKNLRKPYGEKITQQNEKLGELRRNLSTLQAERKAFIESAKVKQAQEKGEMDVDSVIAFLNLHKIKDFGSTIKLKKVLSNGIKAFQEKPTDSFYKWNKLFLFKGTDLVGFWRKRDSEHPGDDVYSEAWIGVKLLIAGETYFHPNKPNTKGNDIEELEFAKLETHFKERDEQRVRHSFYRHKGYHERTDPTIQQFLDYAETFNENLVAIDVTDEKTRHILHAEPS